MSLVGVLAIGFLLATVAVPPGARVDRAVTLGGGFSAVVYEQDRWSGSTYARRTLEIRRHGTVVQRLRARNLALLVQAVDITGDGVRDLLTFSSQGGSGGWGAYRLYAGPRLRDVWLRSQSWDTGFARLTRHGLVSWTAVLSSKTRASRDYPHCCWRLWRRSVWRWSDHRLGLAARAFGPRPRSLGPLGLRGP